jgi:4-amino-4-deoxy-L-arabinose transferase-like glycosyltransferase
MRPGISSRAAVALAAIFALALVLRLAWLAGTDTVLLPLSDPQYYHATAQNIAEGRGYSVAVDQRGFVAGDQSEGTAFWAPGYPLALAPLYKLFGSNIGVARAFNAVAGALTVLPVFVLAARLGGKSGVGGEHSKQQTANSKARGASREQTAESRGGRESREQGAESRGGGGGALVFGLERAEATGLLAALLFALGPALIFWTASLFSEPLFTLGIASTLAVALWAGERRSVAAYFAAGIVLTATAFVRSQGMLMIVPVAVLLLAPLRDASAARAPGVAMRDLVRVAVPVAAAIALLVVPWAVRNQAVMGRPYLINDSLGYNLRLAHGPYSKGTSVPPQDLWDERPGISFKQREIFFDDEGRSRALTYMREHPGREVTLAFRRIGYLLRSDAEASVQWSESLGATPVSGRALFILLGDLWYYPMLLLAAASLIAVPRTRVWLALWSALAVWGALHLVFAGEPRYHVPLLPAVAALAAATVVRAGEMLTAGPSSR